MGRRLSNSAAAEAAGLAVLGGELRRIRKSLGLTLDGTARAAGISRVTLHRIEKGEPNVSFGAVVAVADVLGAPLQIALKDEDLPPDEIVVADFPGLRSIAWQLSTDARLTPREAWSTYTRNWRHLNQDTLPATELKLLGQLRQMFERREVV